MASNNLSDVVEYVGSLDIRLITSSMILSKSFEKNIISKDAANSLWLRMIENGLNLPKDSFSEYYDELYDIDCERFFNGKLK